MYKFLKHITGIADADNYIKIFPITLLQFKLRNGMLPTKDFYLCQCQYMYIFNPNMQDFLSCQEEEHITAILTLYMGSDDLKQLRNLYQQIQLFQ